jgi:hypothetical protein
MVKGSASEGENLALFELTQTLAEALAVREQQPRFPCHYIFLALARNADTLYSLKSA